MIKQKGRLTTNQSHQIKNELLCLAIRAVLLSITTLDVGNTLLIQATCELRPSAYNDPKCILWGGWGLLRVRIGRRWLRCGAEAASLPQHLDRGCPLAGVKFKKATIVVSSTVASAHLGKDPAALAVAGPFVWLFCRSGSRGCLVGDWRGRVVIGSRLIRRSWSEDRRSRLQPVRLLHLVAHPGDDVANLHPIFVVVPTRAIGKIPEQKGEHGRATLTCSKRAPWGSW